MKYLARYRQLIWQMTCREVAGRYKGSFFGLAWSLFNPLLMLVVYTFVFSVVFKSHWENVGSEDHFSFALILFTGLIVFNIFAECIGRAPSLINSNVNYVKKVVFPLEILPIVSMLAALFHAAVSLVVLVAAFCILRGVPPVTILLLPVVILPLLVATLGLSWILASLGVFVRDVSQTVGILISILMFMSPIFYPLSALPPYFQKIVLANPLAGIIEQARRVVIWGYLPNWEFLAVNMIEAIVLAVFGFWWFKITRKGFADVL